MRYCPTRKTRPSPRGRWTIWIPRNRTAGRRWAMTRAADAAAGREEGAGPVRVLVADADCALFGLLEEWFAASGWQLAGVCGPDDATMDGYDLIVVDVPFPRQGAAMLKA